MAFTKGDQQRLSEVHTVLLGANGAPGLAERFEELATSHFKLKRNFWILVTLLVGTGAISVGALEVFGKVISGS